MRQRRSDNPARPLQQLDMFQNDSEIHSHSQVVGARHAPPRCTPGGGGYLDSESASELRPRRVKKNFAKKSGVLPSEQLLLDELAAMGLSRVVLALADELGFEAFMRVWRVLDAAPELLSDNEGTLIVRMPRLRAYQRFQRNRLVETLAAMGYSQREVQHSVSVQLGEELSDRHTRRLMAARRGRISR
jgi:hypothetical protein